VEKWGYRQFDWQDLCKPVPIRMAKNWPGFRLLQLGRSDVLPMHAPLARPIKQGLPVREWFRVEGSEDCAASGNFRRGSSRTPEPSLGGPRRARSQRRARVVAFRVGGLGRERRHRRVPRGHASRNEGHGKKRHGPRVKFPTTGDCAKGGPGAQQ